MHIDLLARQGDRPQRNTEPFLRMQPCDNNQMDSLARSQHNGRRSGKGKSFCINGVINDTHSPRREWIPSLERGAKTSTHGNIAISALIAHPCPPAICAYLPNGRIVRDPSQP
jgi:hypothetical protein